MVEPTSKPFLTNRLYDVLKWIAQIFLPAVATLYFGLAGIWNLPNPEQIVGTITAVDLFLGLLLGLSAKQYGNSDAKFDGAINIEETENSKMFSLDLKTDPEDLEAKQEVLFKVNPPSA